jgi:hypothetical protein
MIELIALETARTTNPLCRNRSEVQSHPYNPGHPSYIHTRALLDCCPPFYFCSFDFDLRCRLAGLKELALWQ